MNGEELKGGLGITMVRLLQLEKQFTIIGRYFTYLEWVILDSQKMFIKSIVTL